MDYEIVVGLEVHAELSTKSKAYCSCENSFGGEVNSKCCEICTGMPGAMPTLNEKLIEYAIKMGLALNCDINILSKQDRKHYFYPDLPKAFQISQHEIPICGNGHLDVVIDGKSTTIGIERVHIEEDSGKLLHDDAFNGTLIDFNRSSVPLLEIVSKPDIRSSEEAKAYLDTIRQILIYLGISDGKMQEGSIRCDVNVSVREKGTDKLGTRVEMKNVNTFSGAARAIEYEAKRQISVLESGGTLEQETRRWDDANNKNDVLRTKDNALDYRFFPEPDLGTIALSEELVIRLKNELPELPNQKLMRFINDYGLSHYDASILIDNFLYSAFFEKCVKLNRVKPSNIANWIMGDITKVLRENSMDISESKLSALNLVDMIELIEKNEISNTSGKAIIDIIVLEDKDVSEIVKEKGLSQISDDDFIENIAKEVLLENQDAVERYHAGKTNVLGFLVGQGMQRSKGKANPASLNKIMIKLLS